MITFDHSVPATMIYAGIAVAIGICAFGFIRYLKINLHNLLIALIRILFFFLLLWCMLQPERRKAKTHMLKPRFVVAADVSSSMLLTPSEEVPKRWDLATEAMGMDWTKYVRAECEIDTYTFGEQVSSKMQINEAIAITPEAKSSMIRDSLKKITGRYAGQNVAGFVLFTDGLDTREADDSWASETWPFPIFTVSLEPEGLKWEGPPDVRIDSVNTPRRVSVGWQTELKVVISGENTGGAAQTVQLFKNGARIDEMPFQLPKDGGKREIAFQLDHPDIGSYTYRVHIPPIPDEKNIEDNDYEISVLVVDVKNRLLYVEGPPRWESKYLARILMANEQMSPLIFLRGMNGKFMTRGNRGSMTPDMRADQLAFFKIVILGNLDGSELGTLRANNLVKFVDTGGSLVLLGGTKSWGPDGFVKTPLKKILPVKDYSTTIMEGNFPASLTDDAQSHPAFEGDSELWEKIPPTLSVFPNAQLSLGAQSLITVNTPQGEQPMIVTHRYGQGKVCVILTDSLWKWTLTEDSYEHKPYARFWVQLLSWLTPEKEKMDSKKLDVFADREQLYLGEKVTISARQMGSEIDESATVQCEVATPDQRKLPFTMASQYVTAPGGKSYPGYATAYEADKPGIHYVKAFMTADGKKVESDPISFFVKPFTPESIPRPSNFNVLKSIARSSGGKYYKDINSLNDAINDLNFASIEEETVEYESLWERWLVILVLMGLLTAGWVMRKLRNMP